MKKRLLSLVMALAMIVGFAAWVPELDLKASAAGNIEAAVQWAIEIANDDSHGYSWDGRWGPDYDCSSLVISAFRNAGFSLSSASTTRNMKAAFENEGFIWIPASEINLSNSNSLQRGDILLNTENHTEIYIGNGENVGAHRGYISVVCGCLGDSKSHRHGHYSYGEKKGDQDGGEISVGSYYNYPWNGILRYDNPVPLALTDGEKVNLGDRFTAEIVHAKSGKKITNSSDNAVLYAEKTHNTAAQRWDFTRNSDGSYTISNNTNHKVLDLDNSNNTDEANIHLWKKASPKTANQKWFIHKRSDEKYYLRPACSESRVLDLAGGMTSNDTNVQLFEYNGTNAQLFYINKTQQIADLGKDFYGLILNYDAWKPILQADNNNIELGLEIAPIDKSGKIHKNANYDRTLWHFKRNADEGSYVIYSVYNNYCLKVSPDKNNNFEVDGNNVKCYNGDGSTRAQRWFIIKVSDDKYTLRPLGCSKVMDLTGNNTADGTNIEVFTSNNTAAQIFNIYKLDNSRDTLNYSISAAKTTIQQNQKIDISVGGTLNYAHNFKFHIIDPDGNETVKNNNASPVYSFSGSKVGKYIIYAEVKNPVQSADIGSKTKKYVTINVTCAHKISAVAAKAANCTENGCKAYWYCSNCKKYFSDKDGNNEITLASTVINATGHNYGTPSYTWSSDGKTCTAKRVCMNDSSHIETENATITSKVKTEATCTAKGTTTYTAIFKNTAFNTQTKDVQDIAVTDHFWSAWTTTKKATCIADGSKTRTCSVCKKTETATIAKLGHDYVASFIPPTCSTNGYTLYKCSRCNDEFKDNYTEPTGEHKWSDWKTTAFDASKGTKAQERTCSVCKTKETQTVNDAIVRFKGSGRYATAAAISQGAYPKTADTVVLANGTKFADALAGATLANAYKAPILLTEAGRLPDETLAEIKRLKAKNVIIIGGSASVGQAVKDTLKKNGLEIEIVKGKTKYATAVEIANATKSKLQKDPTEIFFVSADKFADALSVSAVAAKKNAPIIYLPKTGSIDADTAAYLKSVKGKIKNAYVIGGSGVIGADVMTAAGKALGLTVDKNIVRVKGKTKYDTCVEVNTKFADVLNGSAICVATGEDFPDALAGGVFAAKNTAPLFLASGSLSENQKTYLKTKKAESIFVFGGSKSVPNDLVQSIATASL